MDESDIVTTTPLHFKIFTQERIREDRNDALVGNPGHHGYEVGMKLFEALPVIKAGKLGPQELAAKKELLLLLSTGMAA